MWIMWLSLKCALAERLDLHLCRLELDIATNTLWYRTWLNYCGLFMLFCWSGIQHQCAHVAPISDWCWCSGLDQIKVESERRSQEVTLGPGVVLWLVSRPPRRWRWRTWWSYKGWHLAKPPAVLPCKHCSTLSLCCSNFILSLTALAIHIELRLRASSKQLWLYRAGFF